MVGADVGEVDGDVGEAARWEVCRQIPGWKVEPGAAAAYHCL